MDKEIPCPLCHKTCIKHSKFEVKASGRLAQRYRCKPCSITFSFPTLPSFFKRAHTPVEKFDRAIMLFSTRPGWSLRAIAKELRTRPNTIIEWINKVKNKQLEYRNHLKTDLSQTDDAIDALFDLLFERVNL